MSPRRETPQGEYDRLSGRKKLSSTQKGRIEALKKQLGIRKEQVRRDISHAFGTRSIQYMPVSEERVQEVDQLIERAESGMTAFRELIEVKIRELNYQQDQWLLDHISGPFEVMEHNKSNPHRNLHRFMKANAGKKEKRFASNQYFFYDIMENTDGLAAGFLPARRTMELSPTIDPNNYMDMLVVSHETKHAAHDGNIRATLSTKERFDKYVDFMTGKEDERHRMDLAQDLICYSC